MKTIDMKVRPSHLSELAATTMMMEKEKKRKEYIRPH